MSDVVGIAANPLALKLALTGIEVHEVKAVEDAEDAIAAGIRTVSRAIDELETQLLSDEEIERLTGQWGEEIATYYQALIEDFIRMRREVFDEAELMFGQLTETITDADMALISLNKQFENWMDQLVDAGASIAEQNMLLATWAAAARETIAKPFMALQEEIDDWRTERERAGWSMDDWLSHFDSISRDLESLARPEGMMGLIPTTPGADLTGRWTTFPEGEGPETLAGGDLYAPAEASYFDAAADEYYDDALDLMTDQWETLKKIEELAQEQIAALETTSMSIYDLMDELMGRNQQLAGGTSTAYWEDRYDELLAAAMAPEATAEDVAAFEEFVPDFLEYMQTITPNYAPVVEGVLSDLTLLQEHISDLMMSLDESIPDMTGIEPPESDSDTLSGILDVLSQDILNRLGDIVLGIQGLEFDLPEPVAPPTYEEPTAPPTVPTGTASTMAGGFVLGGSMIEGMSPEQVGSYVPWVMPVADQSQFEEWKQVMGDIYGLTADQIMSDIGAEILAESSGKQYDPIAGIPHGFLLQWDQGGLAAIRYYKEGGFHPKGLGMLDPEEWVVPTMEPEAGRFLRDVGADPELIAEYVAAKVAESGAAEGGDIVVPVTLTLDGEVVARTTARQIRKGNPDLVNNIRKYV